MPDRQGRGTRSAADEAKLYAIPCPDCGAVAGQACVNEVTGNELDKRR